MLGIAMLLLGHGADDMAESFYRSASETKSARTSVELLKRAAALGLSPIPISGPTRPYQIPYAA